MALSQKVFVPVVAGLAIVTGLAGGSLLNASAANAASATGSTDTSSTSTTATQPYLTQGGHVGSNGTREEVLTGDTLTKAEDAAKAAVAGATVLRVETDAEGAAYEVHMQKSDGSQVTVKLDSSFKVTSTEDGMR